jgi:hypothetical protein
MSNPKKTVEFTFTDPTDALVRLLLLGPLAANDKNLSFFHRDGDYYADFADGARMRRICEEMPAGAAPLTSVLFFDEIQLDQKGYRTGDGVLLMGGFFNRAARESLYAKYSLGTLPTVQVPKVVAKKVVYLRFLRAMRAKCHAAILACYVNFNNAGGAVLKLQSGRYMYFPRAVILAIYADFPAGTPLYFSIDSNSSTSCTCPS